MPYFPRTDSNGYRKKPALEKHIENEMLGTLNGHLSRSANTQHRLLIWIFLTNPFITIDLECIQIKLLQRLFYDFFVKLHNARFSHSYTVERVEKSMNMFSSYKPYHGASCASSAFEAAIRQEITYLLMCFFESNHLSVKAL